MDQRQFGAAGDRLVLEECLTGPEVSFFAISDGHRAIPVGTAQDHKRIFDDDQGPNTGGMGAFAPSPLVDAALSARIMREIVDPVIAGMRRDGHEYRGFLYVGLMLTCDGPKVIEFNVRFGDPEAQVVLPSLAGELAPVLMSAARGELTAERIDVRPEKYVGVVLASQGYPQSGPSGLPIAGVERADGREGVMVFHAGTARRTGWHGGHGGRPRDDGRGACRHVRRGDREGVRRRARDPVRGDAVPFRHRTQGGGRDKAEGIREKALLRGFSSMSSISVLILMGSDSDAPVMQAAVDVLREFDVPCEMTVASAHRSPERVMRLVAEAPGRGVRLFIVGAGAAAHLGGVVAAHTTLPVIGVPIDSSALKGMDALLSTVQMPPGVPVATVSIGKPGATNAGVLAVQMLALGDASLAERLTQYKRKLADKVEQAAARLQQG